MSGWRDKALRHAARAGVIAALVTGLSAPLAPASAQELSDRAVEKLMDFAWTLLPSKFTAPTGQVIEVDKSKREENMVSMEAARRVIQVARRSAHAQICKLPQAQAANYQTMMRVEKRTNNWTEQQMLFVSQLHLFTVMWLTGNVSFVERETGNDIQINDGNANTKEQTCTEEQRTEVQIQIRDYICKEDPENVVGCTS